MTRPRSSQISLADTPYYHCIARCVRRAFLCGDDRFTGKNFEHRRRWLRERIRLQASVFAIDICAYAIMHNHYHVVLHVDSQRAASWSNDEVLQRWCRVYKGPLLVQQYLAGDTLLAAQLDSVMDIAKILRRRLSDISWFMRGINEDIARKANAEDDCKGRFWEGRFTSQALLDETALLSCMAYVDLNPVRAGICDQLHRADFTSVQERIRQLATREKIPPNDGNGNSGLLPFADRDHPGQVSGFLPFHLDDYIDLVDWTGRAARPGKRGRISDSCPTAVGQLGVDAQQWLLLTLEIQKQSLQALGSLESVQRYNRSMGRQWLSGQRQLERIYRST